MGTPAPVLGRFVLRAPLGQGGMATVWRAEHEVLGRSAAVKVIPPRSTVGGDPLRREIEAVAALDHPHVIRLYDFGAVDESSGFEWGSRWLAMELADAGSLHSCTPADWPTVGRILLQILSALAHAHARGVVHRDLKPENVLLARGRAGLRVKLTDFGIAAPDLSLAEKLAEVPRPAGTPLFMAPEQLQGRWRDYGPATDLYALGCIAHELCCGSPPFDADTIRKIVSRHLEGRPAPFDPRFEVPEGIREWVRGLYDPIYSRRFAYASDAARALLSVDPSLSQLGAVHPSGQTLLTRPIREPQDTLEERDGLAEAFLETIDLPEPLAEPSGVTRGPLDARAPVRVPVSWADDSLHAGPDLLVGVGAGLFGVRQVPYVGRVPERERLWRRLRECERDRAPWAVVLRGTAGVGKTRLAEWLSQRAAELGAGVRLKGVCDPMNPGGEVIGQMLSRRLRCMGLSRAEAYGRLAKTWSDAVDVHALVELMFARPPRPGEEDPVRSEERKALRLSTFHATLGALARRRPAIVWIEDVQWDLEALAVVHDLLERPDLGPVPALFLLTAREEDVEGPAEAGLAALLGTERAEEMRLGPMGHEEIRALTASMLPLDPELALEVVRRAGGSPLFAIQTLREWVEGDVLQLGADGFRLPTEARDRVARDVETLWRRRLRPALEELADPEAGRIALELAAVLGVEVDVQEWRALREAAGVEADVGRLSEELTGRGLILWGERGWSFAHATLRQSLLSSQAREGRADRHHHLAAEVLETLYGEGGAAERRAALLLAAGDEAAAVAPLMDAAHHAWGRGDYLLADSLLERREEALDALDVRDDDPRRLWGRALRARAMIHGGQPEAAREHAAAVTRWAEHPDAPPAAIVEAAVVMARLAHNEGDVVGLEREYGRIQRVAEDSGDPRLVGRAAHTRGDLARIRGRLDEAERCFRDALAAFESLDDPYESAASAVGLAEVLRRRGRHEEALELAAGAEVEGLRAGSRLMQAQARNVRAETKRNQGELEEAEALYAEVFELLRSIGHQNARVAVLNLGILKVATGRYADAEEYFERARALLEDGGMGGLLPYAHAGSMASRAAAGDWLAFDESLEEARRRLAWIDMADPDLGMLFETAGDLAREADPVRARRAYEQALGQYENGGRPERVAAVRTKVREL